MKTLLLLALLMPAPVIAQVVGQAVRLLPQSQTVSVGDLFTLEVWCPAAADTFNGFAGAVAYDSMLVQPEPGWPGAYITGACGAFFHDRHWHTGVYAFSAITLCGQGPGSNLTGPGHLYTLQMRALAPGQWTPAWVAVFPAPYVQDPIHHGRRYQTGYLHGGPWVVPLVVESATVTIVGSVGVGPSVHGGSPAGVYDVQGRRVDPAMERSGITFKPRGKRVTVR